MPASSGSAHSAQHMATASTPSSDGEGSQAQAQQAASDSSSADSTTGAVTLGRPLSSESARVSHLRLLRRSASLREEAQHLADQRNRGYSVLHLLAAAPATPLAQGSVPPHALCKSSAFGGATVHALRASIPSSVWSGPSPLLTIEPHTLTPSKCTWSMQQLQHHAALQSHHHHHQHHHQHHHHHRTPKIQYVSVAQCYEEERADRAANCAQSKELLKRARHQLDHAVPERRARLAAATKAHSESNPRTAASRARSGQSQSTLSRTEAQSLLAGPTARQYGAAGAAGHQPKSSLHMLLPDDLTELQRAAAANSDQLPAGQPVLGAGSAASAESLDPAEAARQKARTRMAAAFTSIEAQSRLASEAAHRADSFADWTRRIEWYVFGLLASLYFAVLTPFSTAFYSSSPSRWVNLQSLPFNPRLDHDRNEVPGGPWHYPFFEDSAELHWYSPTVLPWMLCDLLLSAFFGLEIFINLRYHCGGYLYSATKGEQLSKEEEAQEMMDEAERQREAEMRGEGVGWISQMRCCSWLKILRTKRWRNYMRHGLWMDLIACALPFELYSVCGGSLRWTFLMRLVRVWWSHRFVLYISLIRARWKDRIEAHAQAHTQRIAFLSMGILVTLHWFACAWFFIAAHDYSSDFDGTGAHNSWLKRTCVSVRDCSSLGAGYLFSLYWAFGNFAMMGCSDVIARTDTEVCLNILILWVGFCTEKLVVATITSAMSSLGATHHHHEKSMAQLNNFLTQHHLPPSIRHQVNVYGDFMWAHFSGGTERDILDDLPISLRKRTLKHILSELVGGSDYFESMPEKLVQSVCLFLRPMVAPPNAVICHEQPYGRELFFLSRGEVERMVPDGSKIMTTIKAGECFGVLRMFSLNQQRQEEAAAALAAEEAEAQRAEERAAAQARAKDAQAQGEAGEDDPLLDDYSHIKLQLPKQASGRDRPHRSHGLARKKSSSSASSASASSKSKRGGGGGAASAAAPAPMPAAYPPSLAVYPPSMARQASSPGAASNSSSVQQWRAFGDAGSETASLLSHPPPPPAIPPAVPAPSSDAVDDASQPPMSPTRRVLRERGSIVNDLAGGNGAHTRSTSNLNGVGSAPSSPTNAASRRPSFTRQNSNPSSGLASASVSEAATPTAATATASSPFPLERDPSTPLPSKHHRRLSSIKAQKDLSALFGHDNEAAQSIFGLCKATAFCEIYVLSNDDLAAVLARWPAERAQLLERARDIQRKMYETNQALLQQLGANGGRTASHTPMLGSLRSHSFARSASISETGGDSTRHLFTRHNSMTGTRTGDVDTQGRRALSPSESSSRKRGSMQNKQKQTPQSHSTKVFEMIRSAAEEQRKAESSLELQSLAHADASKRDMQESAARHRWWQVIIAPASRFRVCWSIVSLLAVLYFAISVPATAMVSLHPFLLPSDEHYRTSWAHEPRLLFVNLFVDLFFWADILLHWNHFAFMQHGLVIRKLRSIRRHYAVDKSDIGYYWRTPLAFLKKIVNESACIRGIRRSSARRHSSAATAEGGRGGAAATGKKSGHSSGSSSRIGAHHGLLNGLLLDICMSFPLEVFALIPQIGLRYGGLLRLNRLLRLIYLFYYFGFIELFLQNVEREHEAHQEQPEAAPTDAAAAGVVSADALSLMHSGGISAIGRKDSALTAAPESVPPKRMSLCALLRSSFFSFHINHKFLHVFRYMLVLCLALWLLGFGWILLGFVPSVRGISWLERDHLHVSGSVTHTLVRSMWLVLLSRTFDCEAVSDLETCGSLLIILIGIFLVPTIVGLLGYLVENLDAVSNAFEEKRTIVRSYMNLRDAPASLQTRVLSYYDFLWAQHSVDEEHVQHHLPSNLSSSISGHRFEHILPKFEFVRGCDAAFLRDFAAVLQLKVLPPLLRYYTAGSMALEMFVLVSGELRVVDGARGEMALVTLLPGSVYGTTTLLIDPPPIRDESVVCIDYSQLVCLSRESLLDVLDLHPISHEFISRKLERETKRIREAGLKGTRNLGDAPAKVAMPSTLGVNAAGATAVTDSEPITGSGAVVVGAESAAAPATTGNERRQQKGSRKRNLGILRAAAPSNVGPQARPAVSGSSPVAAASTTADSHSPSAAAAAVAAAAVASPLLVSPKLMVDEGFLILPNSRFNFLWHVLCLLANIWNICTVPMRIAFLSDPHQYAGVTLWPMYVLDYVTDVFFVVDIVVRSRFMSVLLNGETIRLKRMIWINYLRSGFLTDVLAALPLDLFALMAGIPPIGLPYYRINNLLRFHRQPHYFSVMEQYLEQNDAAVNTSILRSTQLFLMAAQVTHWVACLWFGIEFSGYGDSFAWVSGGSWAEHDHIHHATISWQYHRSLYWSLSVMCIMHQGDINPHNLIETFVFTIVMLVGVTVYAAFIANFVMLLTHQSSHTQPFYDHVQQLTQFMDTQRLPSELRRGIHAYYHRVLMRHQAIEESLVYEVLPDFFRSELTHALARPVLQRIPALGAVSPDFLTALLTVFHPQIFVPHQFIVRLGQLSNRLFLLLKGSIERWDESGHVLEFLKDGDYFGWGSLLRPRLRKTSMLPVVFSDTFMLMHDEFIAVIKLFPEQLQVLYGPDASWTALIGDDEATARAAHAKSAGANVKGSRAAVVAAQTDKLLHASKLSHKIRQKYHDDASMEHLRAAAARSKREAAAHAVGLSEPNSPMFQVAVVPPSSRSKREKHLSQVGSLVESVLPPVSTKDLALQSFVQRSRLFYGQMNLLAPSIPGLGPDLTSPTIADAPALTGEIGPTIAATNAVDDSAAEGDDHSSSSSRSGSSSSESSQQADAPAMAPFQLGSVEEENSVSQSSEGQDRSKIHDGNGESSAGSSDDQSSSDDASSSQSRSTSSSDEGIPMAADSELLGRRDTSPRNASAAADAAAPVPSPLVSELAVDSLSPEDIDKEQHEYFLRRSSTLASNAEAQRSARQKPKSKSDKKQRQKERAREAAEKMRVVAHAQKFIRRASLAAMRDEDVRAHSRPSAASISAADSHGSDPRSSFSSGGGPDASADSHDIEMAMVAMNNDQLGGGGGEDPDEYAETAEAGAGRQSHQSSVTERSGSMEASSATGGASSSALPMLNPSLSRRATPHPQGRPRGGVSFGTESGDPLDDEEEKVEDAAKTALRVRRRSILETMSSNPLFAGPQNTVRQAHISSPWVKTSFRRNVWGTCSLLMLLYYLMLTPFHIAFYATTPASTKPRAYHEEVLLMGWIADVFFIVDIVLRLTKFVRISNGGEVLAGWASAKKYLKSWQFTAHCIQAAPVDVILLVTGQPIQYVYWVRCTRLIRMHQLMSMLKHFENLLVDLSIQLDQISLRILKIVLFFLLWTHLYSCLYFFIGWYESPKVSWIFKSVEDPAPLDSTTFWYVRSLWWVTGTSHGTAGGRGRYPPTTTVEMLAAMTLQILSAGTDVMFIGTFTIWINSADASFTRFDQKLSGIKRYLDYRRVPIGLRRRILNYYNYMWSVKRGVEESELLADVPFNLKAEVLVYRSSFILTQVPLFSQLSVGIIRAIAVHLRSHTFPPGEYVVEAGDVGQEMYFIENGTVEVIDPVSREIRGKLHSGSFFGELALLTGARRAMSVRTFRANFVDLFILERHDFDTVLEQHPSLRAELLDKVKGFLGGQQYAANREAAEEKL